MLVLQANQITKSYGTTTILSNISLQVGERERIGLVGVNGAGKSTLLQILAGEMSYDSGEIHKPKGIRIGYLAQSVSGLSQDRTIGQEMLSVFEHLVEAEAELRQLEADMARPEVSGDPQKLKETMERYARRSEWFQSQGGFEMEARIRSILSGMGFGHLPQSTPIRSLSGGQKTRLALARLLLQEPDLLLLDEPTNHLDIPTLTWLESYLRAYPGAIVVVSHDRFFLDAIVSAVIEIERTSAKRYTGNYTKFVELKAAELEQQMKLYEKQQEEIERMEDFIRRNIARASTTKRAQSRRKMLARMDRIDRPASSARRASFRFEAEQQTGKDVLVADNVTYAYEAGKPLFPPVSMHLRRGDSLAIIGPNGTGKTTLLRMLIGDLPCERGFIEWGSNVKIGYYDQEQSGLNPNNTVLEEVWGAFPMLEEARVRTVLGNFLFSGEDVLKKISALSGGEKARVSLAKLMLLNANVLILDEPTNHLDLYSKEVLESALLDYEGTLLFISHDRYFLNKIAESILEMSPEGNEYFLGNYDDYLEKKAELVEAAAESQNDGAGGRTGAGAARGTSSAAGPAQGAATRSAGAAAGAGADSGSASDYEAIKQARREERARKRRLEQLEEKIAELESRITALETEMAQPEVYHDYVRLNELQADIAMMKEQLESHFVEWAELAE